MYKQPLTTFVSNICCFNPVDEEPVVKSKSKWCQGHIINNLLPNSSISPSSRGPPIMFQYYKIEHKL